MKWETVVDASGDPYEVHWDGVLRIIRAYARGSALYANTRVVSEREAWWAPELVNVHVDWNEVRSRTIQDTAELAQTFYRDSLRNMSRQVDLLRQMVDETAWYNNDFAQKQKEAMRKTMKNINGTVDRWETAKQVAEVVRDVSGETLLVGSTVLSGGASAAALSALGGGSALKGVAKWQDTGKWEAGLFTASTELLFGALKFKVKADVASKKISETTEQVLTLVAVPKAKAGMEIVQKSIIEGKTIEQAAVSGLLKSSDPAILTLAKELAKPAQGGKGAFFWNGLALIGAGAVKVARDRGAKAVTAQVGSSGRPKLEAAPAKQGDLIEAAVYPQDIVAQMAVRPLFCR